MEQAVVKWSHGRPGHDLDTLGGRRTRLEGFRCQRLAVQPCKRSRYRGARGVIAK